MSELRKLQRDHGGQWLYVKATRKGEAVWLSNTGKMATKTDRKAPVAITRTASR